MASGCGCKCWHHFLIATILSYACMRRGEGVVFSFCAALLYISPITISTPLTWKSNRWKNTPTLAPTIKNLSIYHPPTAIFLPPTSTKVARRANRYSSTHSGSGLSLSQTQELPPKVMELWLYLAHGSSYLLKLKWKEWGSSEHCLWKKKMLPGSLEGLCELAKSQDK